jgi:hypothetical protein
MTGPATPKQWGPGHGARRWGLWLMTATPSRCRRLALASSRSSPWLNLNPVPCHLAHGYLTRCVHRCMKASALQIDK